MDFTKLRPLREIVLVRREGKKQIDDGIAIPEIWQQFGWRATVVSVGKEAENCKPGDEILFLKEHTVLPFKEREMAMTHDEYIFAKLVVDQFVERIIPQNRFAIIAEDAPNDDHGGVYLVNAKQNTKTGTVIRASEKCFDLKEGMRIMYDNPIAACTEDGKMYKIVDEKDVLCAQT